MWSTCCSISPSSYLDRRQRPTIARAQTGHIVTLEVEVVRIEPPANTRQPWRVVVTDGTGFAELVFFKFNRERQMPVGAKLLVSGKMEGFSGRRTISHPEHIVPADRPDQLPSIEPVWPLTGGLWPRQIANAMAQALTRLPPLPEWHDAALLRREKWPPFAEALRAVQTPSEPPAETNRTPPGLRRTAGRPGRAGASSEAACAPVPATACAATATCAPRRWTRFGYTLTRSQTQALKEIDADLSSDRRMLRLLQGDVGSGKTWSRCWPCCARWRPASRPP